MHAIRVVPFADGLPKLYQSSGTKCRVGAGVLS